MRIAQLPHASGLKFPERGDEYAAGLDLRAAHPNKTEVPQDQTDTLVWTLKPGERRLISTGLIVEVPAGNYGRIAPRSGLALKQGIDVMAGVVDSSYRGEVGVVLVNLGQDEVTLKHGDRIAQLIVTPYRNVSIQPAEIKALTKTSRQDGGFGSTGVQ